MPEPTDELLTSLGGIPQADNDTVAQSTVDIAKEQKTPQQILEGLKANGIREEHLEDPTLSPFIDHPHREPFMDAMITPAEKTTSVDITQGTPDHIPPETFIGHPTTKFSANHIDALTGKEGKFPPIPFRPKEENQTPLTNTVQRRSPTKEDFRRLNRIMGGRLKG